MPTRLTFRTATLASLLALAACGGGSDSGATGGNTQAHVTTVLLRQTTDAGTVDTVNPGTGTATPVWLRGYVGTDAASATVQTVAAFGSCSTGSLCTVGSGFASGSTITLTAINQQVNLVALPSTGQIQLVANNFAAGTSFALTVNDPSGGSARGEFLVR